MGWTSLYKDNNMTVDEFFDKDFKGSNIIFTTKGYVKNLHEYYRAAYNTKTKKHFAFVCLLDFRHIDGCNFSYKEMDETMGPNICDCPKEVFDEICKSEPENEWAKEWRMRVRKTLARHELIKSLTFGTTIKFNTKFSFDCGNEDTFMIVPKPYARRKTKVLKSVHYGFYASIRHWKTYDFEVIR